MKKLDCMTRRLLLHRVNGCIREDDELSPLLASIAEEAAFQARYRRERVALRARPARPCSRLSGPCPDGGPCRPPLRAYRRAQRRRRRSVSSLSGV